MKLLILIALLFSSVVVYASHENEGEMNKIRADLVTRLDENRTNTIAVLRQKIQTGSPLEKDAALFVVEEKLVLELVPCVLVAISDRTQAPMYHDTGWTYIGRHAGWVILKFIRKLDRDWLQEQKFKRSLMAICNDDDREALKSLWTKWWKQYQEKQEPQQIGAR